jgi:hypothetical protein
VAEDADHAPSVELTGVGGFGEESVRPGPDHLGAGKRCRVGEGRTGIAHSDAQSQGSGRLDEGTAEGVGSDDEQMGRLDAGLDEQLDRLAAALRRGKPDSAGATAADEGPDALRGGLEHGFGQQRTETDGQGVGARPSALVHSCG